MPKLRVWGSDEYVSVSRARWLISGHRARIVAGAAGPELAIVDGSAAHSTPRPPGTYDPADLRGLVRWTATSRPPELAAAPAAEHRGYRMAGAMLPAHQ